jgi:hypothetical protein
MPDNSRSGETRHVLAAVSGRVPVFVNGTLTGTASAILDFAGPGKPVQPAVITSHEIAGKLIVGHTRSRDDPDAPIMVEAVVEAGTPSFNARCAECPARSTIGQLGTSGDTLLVIEHAADCPRLAAFAALVAR